MTAYCLDLPMMVLAVRDNHQSAATIHEGSIVTVIGPAEDDRFMIVTVGDEQFHAFASDLAERGKQIKRSLRAAR